MGKQCHVKMEDVFYKMHSFRIDRDHYETGGGENQDQPWDAFSCEIVFPDGPIIYGNIGADDNGCITGFWFDSNEWGNNRWQLDVLKENNIPFIEN